MWGEGNGKTKFILNKGLLIINKTHKIQRLDLPKPKQ